MSVTSPLGERGRRSLTSSMHSDLHIDLNEYSENEDKKFQLWNSKDKPVPKHFGRFLLVWNEHRRYNDSSRKVFNKVCVLIVVGILSTYVFESFSYSSYLMITS